MTYKEAKKRRADLERTAEMQTDEDALETVWMFPEWGAGVAYEAGQRIRYEDVLYRCEQAHTSQTGWEPPETRAVWTPVSVDEWPEWIQPTGAQDAYSSGDKVSHNDKHWVSDVDGNVWEPGVWGWTEVSG